MSNFDNSPINKMFKQLANQNEMYKGLISLPMNNIVKQLNTQGEIYKNLDNSPITKISKQLTDQNKIYKDLISLPMSNIIKQLNTQGEIYKNLDIEELKGFMNKYLDNTEGMLEQAPLHTLASIHYKNLFLNIIITIIITYIFSHTTNHSLDSITNNQQQVIEEQRNQATRLDDIYRKLISLEEKVQVNHKGNKNISHYIVQKNVSILSKHYSKTKKLMVLYPNQIVELVEKKGKWVYVKYFNHIDNSIHEGWVLKKYLKLM